MTGLRNTGNSRLTTLLAESFRTEPRETPAYEALQGAYRSRTGVSLRTDGKPQSPCIAAGFSQATRLEKA